jgi:hypothetical protein
LKFPTVPKSFTMALSKEPPDGSFPPTSLAGERFFQKREWLICPIT